MPETTPTEAKLIDLKTAFEQPVPKALMGLLGGTVERALSFDAFNRYYADIMGRDAGINFFERSCEVLGISYEVSEAELENIPSEGPLMIVANHPFGGVDGILLGHLLCSVRPDVRLLVSEVLAKMEGLRPWIISVDNFGGEGATKANLGPMKETLRWLRDGHCLGTFPSGTVSHLHLREGRVSDPEWSEHTAALARKTEATVVPVFFEGRNSTFFQLAGLMHPRLRTALLPKELCRRTQQNVLLRIGAPVLPSKLKGFKDATEATAYLRARTYLLGSKQGDEPERRHFSLHLPGLRKAKLDASAQRFETPVAEAQDATVLQEEVDALPAECRLVEHGSFLVLIAWPRDIPAMMQEIARAREETFRSVGEGTGKALDLDQFDARYEHLFLWDNATSKLVGAYRVGQVDRILAEQGKQGLYTSTLFKYKPALFKQLHGALEIGRSFIVSDYQRKHSSLALIWRGIGEYLVRNPQYRTLFGPVSISGEYQAISKHLMVRFLRQFSFDTNFARYVKATNPPKTSRDICANDKNVQAAVHDIDDVSALISEIEPGKQGIPVLLKHYLKLNGVLVSFNVDEDFGHCIDGLIIVDLDKADPKILKRYMGEEGYLAFNHFAE